ncbi:MAG: glycosyltransferase [Deltaproteobacteria bacterium]|nr:glycosyltransferase [Deltaproteobacteria bacterium]
MKSCITTGHLYGMGGGAKAVFACASGLAQHGQVVIFTRTQVPHAVLEEMPKDGIVLAQYYPGCSLGYDIHINIDHFNYAEPAARVNWAHIFHPHDLNEPPDGYRLLANSAYTKERIMEEWGVDSTVLYIPIEDDFYVGRKEKSIIHISRFAAPTQYADKGHRQMIAAFRQIPQDWQLTMIGPVDPNQQGYLSSLMAEAAGLNVMFAVDQPRERLLEYLSKAAIYWHMTGVSMPDVPGAQEHLGLTTIEAMASGCVPIVRGTGGQKEIVSNKLTGIHVESARELGVVTRALVDDLHLYSLLSQQAVMAGRAWTCQDAFLARFNEAVLDGVDNVVPPMDGHDRVHGIDEVAIIIPVWNSTLVARVLDSIPPGPEVIVVDNGSESEVNHLRIDKCVRLEENKGFAAANMIGLEHTDKPLILALNDDCIPPEHPMWLDIMVNTIDEPGVGVVGAKLLYPDGRLQHAGIFFDWHRDDVGFHRMYGSEDLPAASQKMDVPAVTGACLMCRRELFDMAPDLYPMGNYEDVHLCFSAWHEGWRVVYQPAAVLTHIEGVSKKASDIDFVHYNKTVFIEQWRSSFLDSDFMKGAREANVY